MILCLYISTFFVFILLGKLRTGTFCNPLTYYLLFWNFWIYISHINIYNLYEVTTYTYLVIYLSIFMLSCGYIVFLKKPVSRYDINQNKDLKFKFRYFLHIQIILIFILGYYFIKYNNLVKVLDVSLARTIAYEQGYIFNSYIENFIYNNIVVVIMYLVILITLYNFIINGEKNKNLIFTIIIVLLKSAVGNGRMIFFDIILYALLIYSYKIFFNIKKIKRKKWKKEQKRNIVLITFILMLILIAINKVTANRMGIKELDFEVFLKMTFYNLEQFIIYFTGPFIALSTFFENNLGWNYGFALGKVTFWGIHDFVCIFLNKMGWNVISGARIVSDITKENISIGLDYEFNAFFTSIMNFYVDGGLVGVIVFSFLQGALIACSLNYFLRKRNIFSFILLVVLSANSIISEYRLPASLSSNLIILIPLIGSWYLNSKNKEVLK